MTKEAAFVIMTRIGFAARGLMYLAIGILVIFLGRAEGADGALRFLGDGMGRWILVVIAGGFAAYGLWRVIDAVFGTEHHGTSKKMLGKRLGAGISGVIHLGLAYQTAKLAIGAARSSGNPDSTAQTVLALPGGQLILIAAAIGVGIAAVMQFKKGTSCDFLQNLVPQARESIVKWLGRIGYVARGTVFAIIAYYLLDAGIDNQSWKAGGTEQVFAWLSRPLSLVLAAGLLLFGLYGLIEGWFRQIHAPDVDALAHQAKAKGRELMPD